MTLMVRLTRVSPTCKSLYLVIMLFMGICMATYKVLWMRLTVVSLPIRCPVWPVYLLLMSRELYHLCFGSKFLCLAPSSHYALLVTWNHILHHVKHHLQNKHCNTYQLSVQNSIKSCSILHLSKYFFFSLFILDLLASPYSSLKAFHTSLQLYRLIVTPQPRS